jgi:hypothetical protein
MDTRGHMILVIDGLICGTSLWYLRCLAVAVGAHVGHRRTRVHLFNRVKTSGLAESEIRRTVEPGWDVDMMV